MGERSYSIYEPAEPLRDEAERAERLVFVREGFDWFAMLVPVVWFIYHRLWLPLAGFLVILAGLHGLAYLLGVTSDLGTGLLSLGVSLGFGFLASDIRTLMLERRDYRLVGTVTGHSELDCERRFFDNWLPLARMAGGKGGA